MFFCQWLTYVYTVYTMPNNKLDLEKLMKLVNLMENNRKFLEVVRVNNDDDDDIYKWVPLKEWNWPEVQKKQAYTEFSFLTQAFT